MSGIFWLSGIMYDSYSFKGGLKWAMLVNPINFFANGYRNCFLYHRGFWVTYKTELVIFLGGVIGVTLLGHLQLQPTQEKAS